MRSIERTLGPASALALALIVAACGTAQDEGGGASATGETTGTGGAETATTSTMRDEVAVARLEPTEGNDVRGTVTFTRVDAGVRVEADVEGMSEGLHGFHIHETGDCSAPDASSAGGHFAPKGSPHGAPDDPAGGRHVGDLGNLEAGAEGRARYERVDPVITLDGERSIVGKAVIVHAGEDDLESQPTGAAGNRIACGVIETEDDA